MAETDNSIAHLFSPWERIVIYDLLWQQREASKNFTDSLGLGLYRSAIYIYLQRFSRRVINLIKILTIYPLHDLTARFGACCGCWSDD